MKSFLAQLATSHSMICLDLCVCLSFKRFTILSPLKPVTLFNRYFAGMMFVAPSANISHSSWSFKWKRRYYK